MFFHFVFYACTVLNTLIAATFFVLVPFAYFYYEESEVDASRMKRVLHALKPTGFVLLGVVVLLVIGLFVETGQDGGAEADDSASWFGVLKGSLPRAASVGAFFVACLVLVGFSVYLAYTAYGLSALPASLMLLRNSSSRNSSGSSGGAGSACVSRGARVRGIVLGALLLGAAGVLAASLAATLLDTALHSACGYRCGYVLARPRYAGPLDALLVRLAPLHPLDAVFVALLALLALAATLQGVKALGVRVLWIELHRLRARRTPPQGLVLAAAYLALALLAAQQQLAVAAPRYTAFGAQAFVNASGAVRPCDLEAPGALCHMSRTARLAYVATGTNQSFLGVVFHYATWLFLIVWAVGLFLAFCRPRSPGSSCVSAPDADAHNRREEDDDEEELDDVVLDGSVPAVHHHRSKHRQHSRRKRHRVEATRSSPLENSGVHSPPSPTLAPPPPPLPEASDPDQGADGEASSVIVTPLP